MKLASKDERWNEIIYLVRSGRTERKRYPGVSAGYKNGRVRKRMNGNKNCSTCRYHSENGVCWCTRSDEFANATIDTYRCKYYQEKMKYDWRMSVLDRFMKGAGR